MAHDSADDTLSSDELDKALEATETIEDELLASASELPIVEPQPTLLPPRAETHGLVRALWFFGVIVTAMLVLQTVQLLLPRLPHDVAASGGAAPHAAPAIHSPMPAEEIDRTLREMRVKLSRSLYLEVIRVLEPKALDPVLLDNDQRFETYLLLAKAYRALGNPEKAQLWSLRATDQMVERREPAQVVEFAGGLADQGRPSEARVELMKLLARRDAFTRKDEAWLSIAEARVADTWYAQAKHSPQVAPLPGAERSVKADEK
jgi:hypothetical protein